MEHVSRATFGQLFQDHYKTGYIAEIGVQRGHNALNLFRSGWNGKIVCVDNWVRPNELADCVERLNYLPVFFVKGDSVLSAKDFADAYFDAVYIDAGHDYPEVKADFEAWYPKVRSGGIISGHDYGINDCMGVKQFVDEYMAAHPEVKMNFTTQDFHSEIPTQEHQSWWFVKP